MILREMPDLPPRPETPHNAAFRREFYRRWGLENCIVSGWSRAAEYAAIRQTFSVKCVGEGSEDYVLDRRRVRVDERVYLLINENREYGSRLSAADETYSFAIFFRPGLLSEVAAAARASPETALEVPHSLPRGTIEVSERLRAHDRCVSPVLRYIRRNVELGNNDELWYEEQFQFLAARIVRLHEGDERGGWGLLTVRPAKRRELLRRIEWATDYIHAHLHEEIRLADMADAARLSPYHFLRTFRQAVGTTPVAYLRMQRVQRAAWLLETTDLDFLDVATRVGLNNRAALARAFSEFFRKTPSEMRRLSGEGSRDAWGGEAVGCPSESPEERSLAS